MSAFYVMIPRPGCFVRAFRALGSRILRLSVGLSKKGVAVSRFGVVIGHTVLLLPG